MECVCGQCSVSLVGVFTVWCVWSVVFLYEVSSLWSVCVVSGVCLCEMCALCCICGWRGVCVCVRFVLFGECMCGLCL